MKRREFLKSAGAASLVLTGCVKLDKKPAKLRYLPPRENSFAFLEVTGDYREIGFQIGKYFKTNIETVQKRLPGWLDRLLKISSTSEGGKFSEALMKALDAKFPHLLEELRGMAEGASMDFDSMWAMSIKSELDALSKRENPGCSTVFYSAGGKNWLFHNEDGSREYADQMFVLKANPPSGVSYFAFVYPGFITGVGPGINSAGVIECTNFIGCNNPQIGVPRYFLGRAILEAESLDAALEIAQTTPRAFPWHHNLASWKEKKYASIETLPDGTIEIRRPKGIYIHTNHTTGEKTKDYEFQDLQYANSSSVSRYEVLTRKVAAQTGEIEKPETVLKWLASHEQAPYSPCRHPKGDISGETLGTAFFDLDKATMRLYKGNPCEAMKSGRFADYGFKKNK